MRGGRPHEVEVSVEQRMVRVQVVRRVAPSVPALRSAVQLHGWCLPELHEGVRLRVVW